MKIITLINNNTTVKNRIIFRAYCRQHIHCEGCRWNGECDGYTPPPDICAEMLDDLSDARKMGLIRNLQLHKYKFTLVPSSVR